MKKFYFLLFTIFCSCPLFSQKIQTGADRLDHILPLTKGKNIALVVNQTSCLSNGTHLLDTLLSSNVKVVKVFAPEHGFRGTADAGETVIDGKDNKTGTPLVSLYGKNHKPTGNQLENVDAVIFDIQDVGTRFYTYISTMHYVMEACAENGKECIVLDRPNPNDYIDGPVLDIKYKSFVGMHAIPVLHGLTIGELAQMINGEGWLKNHAKCNLTVVPMEGWAHGQKYTLPIKPSPNLPNAKAIELYPSLCFFEATNISIGRGTDFPFQVAGGISKKYGSFSFAPHPTEGAKTPLNNGKVCYGKDLRSYTPKSPIDLSILLEFYQKTTTKSKFFSNPQFMDLLSGTNKLRIQIAKGYSETEIKKTWVKDLEKYKTMRENYLLYSENK